MRKTGRPVLVASAVLASCLVLWALGRPGLVLGTLGCVAFVLGARNLVDALREALPAHPSALVVLALLTAGLAGVALASPEVWPLFVLGYPSVASVVVEAWLRALPALRPHADAPGARTLRYRQHGVAPEQGHPVRAK